MKQENGVIVKGILTRVFELLAEVEFKKPDEALESLDALRRLNSWVKETEEKRSVFVEFWPDHWEIRFNNGDHHTITKADPAMTIAVNVARAFADYEAYREEWIDTETQRTL